MTPITLNDSIVPDYGIDIAPHYRFYVAWTWWDEGSVVDYGSYAVREQSHQRFGGAVLTSSRPTFDVLAVQKSLEQQEGHPVVILFWREQ